jgi:tetratricopeptide (TPR) repeat protein
MAVRLLRSLENNASSKGWAYLSNGDDDKAVLAFEVALKASREDSYRRPYLFYNLACAYARNQNTKRALKNLKLAVESGFADLAHIQQDDDLETLMNTPEFADIIELLKKK